MKVLHKGELFITFLLIGFFLLVNQLGEAQSNSLEPKIIDYKSFPFEINDRWVCIPEGENEIIVKVRAMNTKEMFFYLTPTGTNTASERALIGKSEGKNNIFIIKHIFKKDESILYHFSIEALSPDGNMVTDILFNISRCE